MGGGQRKKIDRTQRMGGEDKEWQRRRDKDIIGDKSREGINERQGGSRRRRRGKEERKTVRK